MLLALLIAPATRRLFLAQAGMNLRALESRFADSPALYANILRYEAQGEITARHIVWQFEFAGNLVTKDVLRIAAQNVDQAAYAAYDRDAAAGERLDSDNAYFPLMRAVGLFDARHDAEALAEIERASRKPQWREYYSRKRTF